jgi:hypothetical protein
VIRNIVIRKFVIRNFVPVPYFRTNGVGKKRPTKGEIDEENDEIAPEPRDLPVVPDQIEVGDP